MTSLVATVRTAPPATAKAPRDRTFLLMMPAVGMLVLMFFLPMVLFFVRTLTEFEGTPAQFVAQVADLLLSQPYLIALATTNWIALIVTVTVLLIGYPIAYYLTTAKGPGISIVVLAIVLPYFTSIIVRTFSWMVLLGEHGLVNDTLRAIGVISEPLPLMYNRLGDARHRYFPAARRRRPRRQWLLHLPPGLFSIEPARRAVGRADRLHPVGRLFHYPGPDGGSARHHGRDADRPRARGSGRLARGGVDVAEPARRDIGPLRDLLPRHRCAPADRSALNHVPLGGAPLGRVPVALLHCCGLRMPARADPHRCHPRF